MELATNLHEPLAFFRVGQKRDLSIPVSSSPAAANDHVTLERIFTRTDLEG